MHAVLERAGAHYRRVLWGLTALAVFLRVLVLVRTPGLFFDMASIRSAADQVRSSPVDLYAVNPPGRGAPVWPYGPLFTLWAAIPAALLDATSTAWQVCTRLLQVGADLLVALVVVRHLSRRGVAAGRLLAAYALLVLGPVLLFVSGVHGQIDVVAFAASAAAVWLWGRGGSNRAVHSGLLIAVALLVKHPAGLLLVPLLLDARGLRERVRLMAAAVLPAALVMLPFVIAQPDGFRQAAGYDGILGFGGTVFLLQPSLALARIQESTPQPTEAVTTLRSLTSVVVLLVVVVVAVLARRWRVPLEDACAALALLVPALAPVSAPWYLCWGVVTLALAGRLRACLVLQLVAMVPMLLLYRGQFGRLLPAADLFDKAAVHLYAPSMLVVAAVSAVIAGRLLWQARAAQVL